MLFDTHAHMDDRAFDTDRETLLSALPEQGIGLLMNPGCSLTSSRAASALASRYDYIYAAVGSHPDAADEVNDVTLEEYRTLCKLNPKIRAIGEIGLDYHYEDIPRDRQQAAFRAQMALALELNLPVIVHEREAHEDGIRIVEEFPEVTGSLPLLFRLGGNGQMADRPGLVHRLYRRSDLQKRPESGGDRRRHSLGPHRLRNRLPLHVPGTLPGKTQRPRKAVPHGRASGGNSRDFRGGSPRRHHGKRETAVSDIRTLGKAVPD